MANPRYNTQVTQPRGSSARVGKMGGGMMRPMYKKGGAVKKRGKDFMSASSSDKRKIAGRGGGADSGKAGEARSKAGVQEVRIKKGIKKAGKFAKKVGKAALMLTPIGAFTAASDAVKRVKKMGGGRIAGAARRAQEHGYYTPDMGMKGGRMYKSGGKVGKKKPRVMGIGIGKIKDYPGMKKIIEMNKKGKKRFRDGGSATEAAVKARKKQERGEALKQVKPSQKGLKKLPTQVRNKMGFMKDGGMARRRNTSRMNRLEELGRVDAERGFTRKGKRNLRAEKKRIVRELKK